MNSAELQKRIDSTHSDITNKQTRLAAIPNEKQRCIISDEKRLILLEKEESELPIQILRLEERVRLLVIELEGALRIEAGGRQRAIEEEAGVVAERIQTSTGAIREMMGALLAAIEGGHTDKEAYATLAAEAEWLALRFDVRALERPPIKSVSHDERTHFLSQFARLLQRTVSGLPWSRLTEDLRIERRRALEHAEAAKPPQPSRIIESYDPRQIIWAKDIEVPLMPQRYGEFIKPAPETNTENEK